MYNKIKYECYKIYKRIEVNIKSYFWIVWTLLFYPRNKIMVISFYADYDETERYKKAASSLSNKLNKWGIPHDFEQINDRGGYRKNTLFKPIFIQKKILEIKRNVLWIDCDTDPQSPEAIYKIATNLHSFCAVSESGELNDMMGWLLKFEIEQRSLKLLELWMLYCKSASDNNISELDHDALKHVILPNFEKSDIVGFVRMKSKNAGFRASSNTDKLIENIHLETSLLSRYSRMDLFKEIINQKENKN